MGRSVDGKFTTFRVDEMGSSGAWELSRWEFHEIGS